MEKREINIELLAACMKVVEAPKFFYGERETEDSIYRYRAKVMQLYKEMLKCT